MAPRSNYFKKEYKNGQFQKIELFLDEKIFILKNYDTMIYENILAHINSNRNINNQLKMCTLRHRFRDLMCSRYSCIRWSGAHTKYLKKHWRTKSNMELAYRLSSSLFRSKKVFINTQVRKKMELLNLHRSKAELSFILKRNIQLGINKAVIPKYIRQRILINKFNKL